MSRTTALSQFSAPGAELHSVRALLHLLTIFSMMLTTIMPIFAPALQSDLALPAFISSLAENRQTALPAFSLGTRQAALSALPPAQPESRAPYLPGKTPQRATLNHAAARATTPAIPHAPAAGLGAALLPNWMDAVSEASLAETNASALGTTLTPQWLARVGLTAPAAVPAAPAAGADPTWSVLGSGGIEPVLVPNWFAAASDSAPALRPFSLPRAPLFQITGGTCAPTVTLTIATPVMVEQGNPTGETFVVVMRNNGAMPIPNVTLPITPSAGFYFVGGSASASSNLSPNGALSLTQPPFDTIPGQVVTLVVAGSSPASTLNAGEAMTFTFKLAANTSAASDQPLGVLLPRPPAAACAFSAPVETSLCTPLPGLGMDLTLPPGLVSLGNTAGDVYTFTLTNNGSVATTDVSLLVEPSAGFYFIGGSANALRLPGTPLALAQPGGNGASGAAFELIVAGSAPTSTLAPGQSIRFTFRLGTDATATSGQPLKVTVQSGQPARQTCDFTQKNVPTGRGNLILIKDPELQSAALGDIVTWTLTARNSGLGNVYTPTVSDAVGPGVTLLSITPPTGSIPPILAPEQSVAYTVMGRVNSCINIFNGAQSS